MKKHLLTLLALVLTACSTTSNPQQAITTATGLAQIALTAYGQYQAAQTGHTDPASAINQASADLNGIAALAQAYVNSGKTPAQANLATGAANIVPASDVVALLPNTTINQNTANTLFAAAKLAK